MPRRWIKWTLCQTALVAAVCLTGSRASAQQSCLPCPSANLFPAPGAVSPAPGGQGLASPGVSVEGSAMAAAAAPSFTELASGAGVGTSAALDPGYIDIAAPRTQFRLRYDSFYGDNRPDRAEFFYPKCGCFKIAGLDPNAKGPPLPETRVDAQELSAYVEYAATERLSGFIEAPVRWINPVDNANASGFSDLNFGLKYAVLYSAEQVLTVQVRAFAPTGDAFKGLGTDDWRLEPALLYERQLSSRMALLAEFRDNIPIDANTDFAGSVLRYGLGVSYLAYDGPTVRVAPILEFVGWTVLDGKEFSPDLGDGGVKDAAGDTIVNVKFGGRFLFGEHADFYVGYGRALTGTVWYKDIVRAEFRLRF